MTNLQSTRAYLTDLRRSLAEAKRVLGARDFEIVSVGIRAEIRAAEVEIQRLALQEFMGVTSSPVLPRILDLAKKVCSTLQTNEMENSTGMIPQYGTPLFASVYSATQQIRPAAFEAAPTLIMGVRTAVCI